MIEKNKVYVFGHRNPDTDSICSAIVMAGLKRLEGLNAEACVLGPIPRETEYVLNTFGVKRPRFLENVRTQVRDLKLDVVEPVSMETSILDAYDIMEKERVRTLPVCDDSQRLIGLLTMKDIAMDLIHGDIYTLNTTTENILKGLGGKPLTPVEERVGGQILVMALGSRTLEQESRLNSNCIAIVGDRYETIELAIGAGVKMIIVTGNKSVPQELIDLACENKTAIISVEMDTYTVSRTLTSCNQVSSIMIRTGLVTFGPNDELGDVQDTMRTSRHTFYPVVSDDYRYCGSISRSHILRPERKRVILVDHNEYGQSASGIEEADVLEIVDHHKIGAVRTNAPIRFSNVPVGSTCTILYGMFLESGYEIDKETAGLLVSGIISDTLYMKSPTTTSQDIRAIKALSQMLDMDMESYAMAMFKEGSRMDGQTVDEILFKDFKTFEVEGSHIGIGQVFTLDIDPVMDLRDELLDRLREEHNRRKNHITMFLATDIIREGSYMFYCTDSEFLLKQAFGLEPEQGMFVNWIVSRKKQVVPNLMEAIEQLKMQG